MDYVELLTIEATFQISGRGVIVAPDFSVPASGWQNREETVKIESPDGATFEAQAQFLLAHAFCDIRLVPTEKRWWIGILFPNRRKEEFPAGSKILVSPELRDLLLP